jgi:hypothetical protein
MRAMQALFLNASTPRYYTKYVMTILKKAEDTYNATTETNFLAPRRATRDPEASGAPPSSNLKSICAMRSIHIAVSRMNSRRVSTPGEFISSFHMRH